MQRFLRPSLVATQVYHHIMVASRVSNDSGSSRKRTAQLEDAMAALSRTYLFLSALAVL